MPLAVTAPRQHVHVLPVLYLELPLPLHPLGPRFCQVHQEVHQLVKQPREQRAPEEAERGVAAPHVGVVAEAYEGLDCLRREDFHEGDILESQVRGWEEEAKEGGRGSAHSTVRM